MVDVLDVGQNSFVVEVVSYIFEVECGWFMVCYKFCIFVIRVVQMNGVVLQFFVRQILNYNDDGNNKEFVVGDNVCNQRGIDFFDRVMVFRNLCFVKIFVCFVVKEDV